ncbi:cathepsin S, ortholog 1 [Clupea harengus]|uniref:Cathepsin S, ortholog 1 n=1 Tax=Clupea harengus TaxID=7950 RepID=A0A6P8GTW8_CLUHA|nr:cathepsin S, ortholog 1 [Clupea harengus]XP_031442604.1 cathepsin S, ortholog 1 [Clupea harengus]
MLHFWSISVFALEAFCHLSCALSLNGTWDMWKAEHSKVYPNQAEEAHRKLIWEKTAQEVLRHNQDASQGLHSFMLGLNHLADLTTDEANKMLSCLKPEDPSLHRNMTFTPLMVGPLPEKVDWVERGLVSAVQNQGTCGSCWAFSSAGALEAQMKHRTGQLTPLSQQNLVDCSVAYGNHGCRGGYLSKSFIYVIQNKGIDSAGFYPYEQREGKCRYSIRGRAGYCMGFRILPARNEKALQQTVANIGPVSVGINAMLPSFHHYRGGIYSDSQCNPKITNHAVLVVGYGTENGQDYWLVKNSWGTAWGEKGYVRMARNKNQCGISNFGIFPKV